MDSIIIDPFWFVVSRRVDRSCPRGERCDHHVYMGRRLSFIGGASVVVPEYLCTSLYETNFFVLSAEMRKLMGAEGGVGPFRRNQKSEEKLFDLEKT